MVIPSTPQKSPNLRKLHNFAGYTNSYGRDGNQTMEPDDSLPTGGNVLGLLTDVGESRAKDPYLRLAKMRNLTPIKKRISNEARLPKKKKSTGPKERGNFYSNDMELITSEAGVNNPNRSQRVDVVFLVVKLYYACQRRLKTSVEMSFEVEVVKEKSLCFKSAS